MNIMDLQTVSLSAHQEDVSMPPTRGYTPGVLNPPSQIHTLGMLHQHLQSAMNSTPVALSASDALSPDSLNRYSMASNPDLSVRNRALGKMYVQHEQPEIQTHRGQVFSAVEELWQDRFRNAIDFCRIQVKHRFPRSLKRYQALDKRKFARNVGGVLVCLLVLYLSSGVWKWWAAPRYYAYSPSEIASGFPNTVAVKMEASDDAREGQTCIASICAGENRHHIAIKERGGYIHLINPVVTLPDESGIRGRFEEVVEESTIDGVTVTKTAQRWTHVTVRYKQLPGLEDEERVFRYNQAYCVQHYGDLFSLS
jgi:hypothetical protein